MHHSGGTACTHVSLVLFSVDLGVTGPSRFGESPAVLLVGSSESRVCIVQSKCVYMRFQVRVQTRRVTRAGFGGRTWFVWIVQGAEAVGLFDHSCSLVGLHG